VGVVVEVVVAGVVVVVVVCWVVCWAQSGRVSKAAKAVHTVKFLKVSIIDQMPDGRRRIAEGDECVERGNEGPGSV
jgi:hypothetical protein